MTWKTFLSGALMAVLTAYGAADAPTPVQDGPVAPPVVTPTDFAFLPCGPRKLPAPCTILMAGGKRVVIGAPAGVTLDLSPDQLRNLDAVLLLSLRGEDIEGLDELRNAAWRAGHEGPLPVAGPAGTENFIGILNRAYEISDALIYVEAKPSGGFDSALLALLPGNGKQVATVFDTGDLRIHKVETGTDRAAYLMDYAGQRAVVSGCGAALAEAFRKDADHELACESDWPLNEPVFVSNTHAQP